MRSPADPPAGRTRQAGRVAATPASTRPEETAVPAPLKIVTTFALAGALVAGVRSVLRHRATA
jgi:hypothetical protein